MTEEKLNNITYWLRENIIYNTDIIYEDNIRGDKHQPIDLIEVIVSLHNELYKEVTGNYYNYFFHWANKIGSDVEDNLFEKANDYTKIKNYMEG